MIKIVAAVLCLSVLVSSQEMFGDGLGGLFALNMLSGRPAFDLGGLFGGNRAGGYPVQLPAQASGRSSPSNAAAAMAAAAASRRQQSPLGSLGGLLFLDSMGVM